MFNYLHIVLHFIGGHGHRHGHHHGHGHGDGGSSTDCSKKRLTDDHSKQYVIL
jgi:hypothetical protein